jgi:hypothetical protein
MTTLDTPTHRSQATRRPAPLSLETARQQSVVTMQPPLDPPTDAATITAPQIHRNANRRQPESRSSLISKQYARIIYSPNANYQPKNRTTATGCNNIGPTIQGNQAHYPPPNSKPADTVTLAIDDTGCNSVLPLHHHSTDTYSRGDAPLVSPCYLF